MRRTLIAVLVGATLAYPPAVYFGLHHLPPQALAVALAALIGLRLLLDRRGHWLPVGAALLVFSLVAVLRGDAVTLRFYPVLVNLAMLVLSAASLYRPPSLIERLARLREPDLPPEGVRYTRRVTQVWCVFFVVNGSVALYTALFTSLAAWTLYNGLLAYLLMGTVFAVELLCRTHFRKRRPS